MIYLSLFVSILAAPIAVLAQCPPLGPTLPLASNLASNPIVKEIIRGIIEELKKKTAPLKSTAFAITFGTTNDDTPLLEFHNAPTVYNTSGSHTLTTDTQFITASISKLFTAYGIKLLSKDVSPTDCVTKYIPELLHLKEQAEPQNAISSTDWSKVTIDALLSHLSGIAEDLGDSDIDNAPGNYSALGLPTLNKLEQGTQCGDGVNPYQRPCTEADFFSNWGRKYPVYAPFTTPVYSNIGYAILGLVIERATGKSYAQHMEEAIFRPLGMKHTSVDQPISLSDAFITKETGDGDVSEGFLASAGAIYSSANDLYTLGNSILSSTLLSPVETRAWLKPRSFTSSAGTFVGEVWEIARGTNLTGSNDGHIVDVYTKGGNLDLYSSIIALVPDYNFTFTLTSAGPVSDTNSGVVQGILSEVLTALIPAFEAANKAQAKEVYAGTYTAGDDSITLAVDDGGGLLVTNFSVNGVDDIVDAVGEAMGAAGTGQTTLRLYPTNLVAGAQTAWQGVYDTTPAAEAAKENALFFFADATCQSWSEISLLSYGMVPFDQFVFTADENGKNVAVNARAWRTVMSRA